MKTIHELLEETGFQVTLRMDGTFDSDAYQRIRDALTEHAAIWKQTDRVPFDEMAELLGLIDQLARGSDFYDEETAVQAEDAFLELEQIIYDLQD